MHAAHPLDFPFRTRDESYNNNSNNDNEKTTPELYSLLDLLDTQKLLTHDKIW